MFNCKINMISDYENLYHFINRGDIIFTLIDNTINVYYGDKHINGSVLLPPYTALEAYLNNDIDTARCLYYEYLNQQDYFISSTILKYIFLNMNITILVDEEMVDLQFDKLFLEYLNIVYGLYISSVYQQFPIVINTAYIEGLYNKLFKYNIMDAEAYLLCHPIDSMIPVDIVHALYYIYKPPVPDNIIDINRFLFLYFVEYKKKIRNDKNIISPISMIGDALS